ncbi:MAG: hypothetical protein ACJ780_17705 [Solirubrobacteraceae bacterium]
MDIQRPAWLLWLLLAMFRCPMTASSGRSRPRRSLSRGMLIEIGVGLTVLA